MIHAPLAFGKLAVCAKFLAAGVVNNKGQKSLKIRNGYGGEGGIRTLDALPHTRFPGVLLRPLGHLSCMTPAAWRDAGLGWAARAGPATSRHTLWLLPLLPSGPGGVHNLTLREGRTGPPWIQPVLLLNAGENQPLGQFPTRAT